MCRVTLLFVGCFFWTANAAKAPFIKPCKMDDSDCLVTSGQAALPHIVGGLPDLGLQGSDPLHIDEIEVNEGGLHLQLTDTKVEGIRMCKILKLHHLGHSNDYHLELECPIRLTGKYTASGKLLVVPAEGDGPFEIKTDNIRIKIDILMDTVDGPDAQEHWKLVNYTKSYETIDKFHFDMKNLFNGNEKKAQPVLEILNHQWKEVIDTFGKPIIFELIARYIVIISKFFEAVPASEL